MVIKGCEIRNIAYLFYFLIELVVDESLYRIVLYGPLLVAVFTLFGNIYVM